ncbi:hypothetical protein RMN57_00695 [Kitasatospora sp. CM 4170]|uniref:Lipoprotein n=1 Tax=Kitasatospora aburaviensis TaxID=67265 RepID=A0ABW1F7K6_9ACTN|nr:hypothetical protein [Kitasatospora sp. CM 4170]WNM43326.1 hypothetical protein RMN57_00695 [Kitasatospora sp. CM 4170]
MRIGLGLRGTALLLVAAALAGCDSQGGREQPEERAAPTWTGPQIAGPGRVVIARCDRFAAQSPTTPDARVHVVTVTAYSVTDGAEVARQVATLPDGGSSDALCDPTHSWLSAEGERQAFNDDFTLLAGTVPGPGNKGKVATAFSVSGGAPVSAGSGAAPDDRVPVFQSGTSTLWYVTGDRHLTSRDLKHPSAAPTDRGTAPGQSFVLAGDQAWVRTPLEVKPDQAAVAPGGTVAVGGNLLWHRTDPAASFAEQYVEPAVLGPSLNGRTALPGSEAMPVCAARLWFDDRSLLCNARSTLLRVTFAADHSRVEKIEPLLPQEQALIPGAVLSPDGRSLAFLREWAGALDLYRLDLSAGATPVRIASLATDARTGSGGAGGDVRLVAWQ